MNYNLIDVIITIIISVQYNAACAQVAGHIADNCGGGQCRASRTAKWT